MPDDLGRDPLGQALVCDGAPTDRHPAGFDPSRFVLREPSPEELHEVCSRKWERSGPFNIDQWPAEVLALSIPTKFIPVTDFTEWWRIFEGDEAVMLKYAKALDRAMGFGQHFIRMNSRSPKDAAYPGLPITCAGKQAMWWISTSERCADDTSLHEHARRPFFICVREWRPIRPAWEFRCFARGGEMIAVSRYDYANPAEMTDEVGPKVFAAAQQFYQDHLKHHFQDVVFDLHAPGTGQQLLIELNPYGLSDPCLFGSYEAVERGGWMIRKAAET